MTLHDDALLIARRAIDAAMPDAAVRRALAAHCDFLDAPGRLILVAVGKAAWTMARAAWGEARFDGGVIVTARGCAHGSVGDLPIIEAGHPIPDKQSILGAETALECVRGLTDGDRVLFLLSGGGSALFEKPLIAPDELARITDHLLRSGADIVAINTIRKRLSAVKGGRFALACRPARVLSLVLSDVLGDPLDMIASGPAAPDASTARDAMRLAERSALPLSDAARACLAQETPKALYNAESEIIGSVSLLCASAADTARALVGLPQHNLGRNLSEQHERLLGYSWKAPRVCARSVEPRDARAHGLSEKAGLRSVHRGGRSAASRSGARRFHARSGLARAEDGLCADRHDRTGRPRGTRQRF